MKNINSELEFASLSEELIELQIDSPLVNTVNLDDLSYDKILNYSKKYPNRIRFIVSLFFNEYDKIKEILKLNKESIACYPHGKFEYLIPLPNASIFDISGLKGDIDNNYNFTKIKCIKGIPPDNENENLLINLLNKCPNVEKLDFFQIGIDCPIDVNILKKINCPKIKSICSKCEKIEEDFDWTIIFEKFPLLEDLSIGEYETMLWTYEVSPIFFAERKNLPFPLLEQLIRNYLNGSSDRTIYLRFDEEFDIFWEYFKDKKEIIYRVSEICGKDCNISLDTYYKCIINKYHTIDEKKGNYIYFFVNTPFNDQIFEYIKKHKIEYLFNKLCELNNVKFIIDTFNKYLAIRINGILQKI